MNGYISGFGLLLHCHSGKDESDGLRKMTEGRVRGVIHSRDTQPTVPRVVQGQMCTGFVQSYLGRGMITDQEVPTCVDPESVRCTITGLSQVRYTSGPSNETPTPFSLRRLVTLHSYTLNLNDAVKRWYSLRSTLTSVPCLFPFRFY